MMSLSIFMPVENQRFGTRSKAPGVVEKLPEHVHLSILLDLCSGMLSAAASLGMILLWDVDGGLTQIDKYLYSSEDYIKVRLNTTAPSPALLG